MCVCASTVQYFQVWILCYSLQVTLVGIVKSIDVSSIKITYTLEDDTGSITGTFWLDGDQVAYIFNFVVTLKYENITIHWSNISIFWKSCMDSNERFNVLIILLYFQGYCLRSVQKVSNLQNFCCMNIKSFILTLGRICWSVPAVLLTSWKIMNTGDEQDKWILVIENKTSDEQN